jgi:3',5'-cyclic AMP phosphodiesterase CpdA
LIPQYYHHSMDEVHGWFQLSSIETLEYDNDIAIRFGDSTAVVLASSVGPLPMEKLCGGTEVAQSSILVLSDLHFGPDYNYLKQGEEAAIENEKHTLTDCLVQDLKRIDLAEDIGAVMITGDFTSNGSWEDQDMDEISQELNTLAAKINVDIESFLTLPGNHDVVRYPKDWDGDFSKLAVSNQVSQKHERDFRIFLNKLQNRDMQLPLDFIERIRLKDADVLIGLLNSCRILATTWTEYGYVGPSGIEVIENIGLQSISRPTFKVVGVHHHLLPVNKVEAPKKDGVTLSLDASQILETAQASGVHIAVHGHQHMPHLSRYQSLALAGGEQKSGLTVVSNGSAGVSSNRRPGEERK